MDGEEKNRPPKPFEWEVPFGYELYDLIRYDENGLENHTPQIRECNRSEGEKIEKRIKYLKGKVIDKTITEEEREELKLLIW